MVEAIIIVAGLIFLLLADAIIEPVLMLMCWVSGRFCNFLVRFFESLPMWWDETA